MTTNPNRLIILFIKRMFFLLARHPQSTALLLSRHGSLAIGPAETQKGAFNYLLKPIDINELMTKIQDALNSVT